MTSETKSMIDHLETRLREAAPSAWVYDGTIDKHTPTESAFTVSECQHIEDHFTSAGCEVVWEKELSGDMQRGFWIRRPA